MASGTPSPRRGVRRRSAASSPRIALALVLLAAVAPPAAGAAMSLPADARDTRGPIDLTSVSLVQKDVRMALRIQTAGTWSAQDVATAPGREICVTLVHGAPSSARGRVCVARRDAKPALTYTPLEAGGAATSRPRHLAAAVRRPRLNVFEATFLPIAAGLPVGRHAWYATSAWTDARGCARACEDRLPDGGVVAGRVAVLSVAPCFGAAARDPLRPCSNPALRLSVEPSLRRAREMRESYCDARRRSGLLSICTFGAAPSEAADTFALVGDSHAGGLKSALEVVSVAKRWRGVSIFRPGCPATLARPALPTQSRVRDCVAWNAQLLRWLEQHREVDTVFLSAHAKATVLTRPGESPHEVAKAGYRAAIRAILRRASRVVVIRDVPSSRRRQLPCIAGALSAGREPGPACALPRADVVAADALAAAAASLRSSHVRLVDLTPHFCDEQRCYPVIGGALVQRDETHLTPVFATTLGPYILRAVGG